MLSISTCIIFKSVFGLCFHRCIVCELGAVKNVKYAKAMQHKAAYTYQKTGRIVEKTTEANREATFEQMTMLG